MISKIWFIIFSYLAFQLSVIGLKLTGPFYDESIYATAGLRTLEGLGINDSYLTWFSGSLLWPAIAGVFYKLGGLDFVRVAALIFACLTLIFFSLAVKNIYGKLASFWATLLLSINGPFLSLSHMGVYDLPALAGVSVSFWAITNLIKDDNRKWVFAAASSYSLAILSKYPIAVMIIPLALTLIKIRRRKAGMDLSLFALIFICFMLAFIFPVREQVGVWLPFIFENSRNFGSSFFSITVNLLVYAIVPLSLIPTLFYFTRKWKIKYRYIFLIGFSVWPLYHLLLNNSISMNKHLVFSFIFIYPLIGVFFQYLWNRSRPILFSLLTLYFVTGVFQMTLLDTAWPDDRVAARYLTENVKSGDKLLINYSWPQIMYLYGEGKLKNPSDVYDFFQISLNTKQIDKCSYEWFVDSTHPPEWPSEFRESVFKCGTYKLVNESQSFVGNFGSNGKFETYPIKTTIYKNQVK